MESIISYREIHDYVSFYLFGPFLQGFPFVLGSENDNWFVGSLEPLDELFGRDILDVNPFNLVLDVGPREVEGLGVALFGPAFSSF